MNNETDLIFPDIPFSGRSSEKSTAAAHRYYCVAVFIYSSFTAEVHIGIHIFTCMYLRLLLVRPPFVRSAFARVYSGLLPI